MTYRLTIDPKPSYLHVIVTGRNTRENVTRYMAEIVRECETRQCRRVLVEERLDGPRLETADVFEIAAFGTRLAAGTLKAIAYVDVNARGDMMKFAETVAVNRGAPVAVFATVAEAAQWLQAGACVEGAPDGAKEGDGPGR